MVGLPTADTGRWDFLSTEWDHPLMPSSEQTANMLDREHFLSLDASDPLAPFRDRFALPDDIIYLDGNSLGALPKATIDRVNRVIRDEWGRDLIKSWNVNDWYPMPHRVGGKIARLIGAGEGEVVSADSTSVNLFKALAAAMALRPDRRVIVTEGDNFPTDGYIAQGLTALLGDAYEVRMICGDEAMEAIDDSVAAVSLTHVNYKTGRMHDMAAITAATQDAGALSVWDLAHSAGAVPVDLNGCNVDFAVGCGYKYLNGGPGAPAFLFAAKRHHETMTQPLTGWMGHRAPFDFVPDYAPAAGIGRALCGTPPVISMAALETSVDLMLEADMETIRRKSLALGDLFIALVEERCAGHGFTLASPRSAERGSQVSFRHEEGYAIMQALIGRGVIGDFRAPDILRFGFTPLYTRYLDVWEAAAALADIMDRRSWDAPEFKTRAAVT